jgi:dTDP-4-dehydrorhamnose reductase
MVSANMVAPKKLLLVGGNGMLASQIAAVAPSIYQITSVDLPEFDMTDKGQVLSCVNDVRPDVIINCAAYTNVDGCETEQVLANLVNGTAVAYLAEASKKVDATLVHISTDYVFDGEKTTPYVEEDQANPQSAYGYSKLLGEQAILSSGLTKYFIVRTSWLYGPGGNNFVETILRLAGERAELKIVADQVGSPTYTSDLADAIFCLLDAVASPQPPASSSFGVYHFANEGQCSWYEFAKEIVAVARQSGISLKVNNILPIKTEEYPLPATRPAYSVFDKKKYKLSASKDVSEWQASLVKYFTIRNQ